jgi:hypothetical protein
MKVTALGLALLIAFSAPLNASAQRQGGGGGRSGGAPQGGGGRPGGAPQGGGGRPGGFPQGGGGRPGGFPQGGGGRPGGAPQAGRAAPSAPRQAGGGFDLPRDLGKPAKPAAPPARGNLRPVINVNRSRGAIGNPAHRGQAPWGWNRGTPWEAAPAYWGGGFWGAFALGAASAALDAAAYGSFTDPDNGQPINSYEVAPGSPGAVLLANYGLTQTPCGAPGLVVIFGPDNSVICARPNDLVGPGNYDLDSSDLTLVSQ